MRQGKFNNRWTKARDGTLCQSEREATRLSELQLMAQAGAITGLRHQVIYQLDVNGVRICDYVADFVYQERGAIVVEDSKGHRTAEYKIKAKLMMAVHGIEIKET